LRNQVACYIWYKTTIQTLKLLLKLPQWQYTVKEIIIYYKIRFKKRQTQNMYAKHVHV